MSSMRWLVEGVVVVALVFVAVQVSLRFFNKFNNVSILYFSNLNRYSHPSNVTLI